MDGSSVLRSLRLMATPIELDPYVLAGLRYRLKRIGDLTVEFATARNPVIAARTFRKLARQLRRMRGTLRVHAGSCRPALDLGQ